MEHSLAGSTEAHESEVDVLESEGSQWVWLVLTVFWSVLEQDTQP